MADASLWDDVLSGFQILGPVTHGDPSGAATIGEMARQILADAPERFALVGFSMGGYVAREIARRASNRVQAPGDRWTSTCRQAKSAWCS